MTQEKTILIVEDEESLREALKFKLEKEGVAVLTASTGEEALEVLKKQRPTLVSLDILLPRMNGLEVLKNIRTSASLHDLPVVVVSVSAGEEKVKEALSMHIIEYIVKSDYSIEDIVNKFKEMLKTLA